MASSEEAIGRLEEQMSAFVGGGAAAPSVDPGATVHTRVDVRLSRTVVHGGPAFHGGFGSGAQ